MLNGNFSELFNRLFKGELDCPPELLVSVYSLKGNEGDLCYLEHLDLDENNFIVCSAPYLLVWGSKKRDKPALNRIFHSPTLEGWWERSKGKSTQLFLPSFMNSQLRTKWGGIQKTYQSRLSANIRVNSLTYLRFLATSLYSNAGTNCFSLPGVY